MELKIGETILRLRRERGLTQEQLAAAVGVSPPAVSKWERGVTCPDIALLAPLARALGATVDRLLSFTPGLTDEEVLAAEGEVRALMQTEGFAAGCARLEELLHQYPNCDYLKFRLAGLLQMGLGMTPTPEGDEAQAQAALRRAAALLEQVEQGGDPRLKGPAAAVLAGLYLSGGEFERAEQLLDGLPRQEVDPADLYTSLYLAKGDLERAEASAQGRLYQSLATAGLALGQLQNIARQRGDEQRLRLYAADCAALTGRFGVGGAFGGWEVEAEHLAREGAIEQALDAFDRYVDDLSRLNFDFSQSPHFSAAPLKRPDPRQVKNNRLLIARMLEEDRRFAPLLEHPRYRAALRRLAESADGLEEKPPKNPVDKGCAPC